LSPADFAAQIRRQLTAFGEAPPNDGRETLNAAFECVRSWLSGQPYGQSLHASTLDDCLLPNTARLVAFVGSKRGRESCMALLECTNGPTELDFLAAGFAPETTPSYPGPSRQPTPGVRDRNYLTPTQIPGRPRVTLGDWLERPDDELTFPQSPTTPSGAGGFISPLGSDMNLSVQQPGDAKGGRSVLDADLLLVFLVTVLAFRDSAPSWHNIFQFPMIAKLAAYAAAWKPSAVRSD